MSNLIRLNITRLLKELDYLKSDFDYKSEVASQIDSEFMKDVDRILGLNPELKELYLKEEVKYTASINEQLENIIEETDVEHIEHSKEEKSLYRQIVKLTHPDKIEDENLNSLYLEATKAYNNGSIIDLVNICNQLGLKYSEELIDPIDIQKEINSIKEHIKFICSTYTWRWNESEEYDKRNELVLEFIKQKIF